MKKRTPTGRNASYVKHEFDPAKPANRTCRCGLVRENPIHQMDELAEASAWAYDDPDFIRE